MILLESSNTTLEEKVETFSVYFEHLISPHITLSLHDNNKVFIEGTVKISVNQMIKNFTSGLGLKNLVDKIIDTKVDNVGYSLSIKDIANACISIKKNKLHVMAEYKPSKEWWAKPVAIIALGKILNDFAINIENSGINPGFRTNIKDSMQQLRKNNFATLDLKHLFENQVFFTENYKVFIKKFDFNKVTTYSEDDRFVISFSGESLVSTERRA